MISLLVDSDREWLTRSTILLYIIVALAQQPHFNRQFVSRTNEVAQEEIT
jgi:hypothetical protein